MKHPLTLEAFADWLARQNPVTEYTHSNGCDCLIYRYLRDAGLPVDVVWRWAWRDRLGYTHNLPAHFDDVSCYGKSRKRTYGGALAYLRGLLV